MKFCINCDRLLDKSTKNGELKFYCPSCLTIFPSTDDDTLMYMQDTKTQTNILPYKLIKNAPFSQTVPRVYNTCKKCKREIVSFIRIGEDFHQLFSCICGNFWEN